MTIFDAVRKEDLERACDSGGRIVERLEIIKAIPLEDLRAKVEEAINDVLNSSVEKYTSDANSYLCVPTDKVIKIMNDLLKKLEEGR